MKKTIALFSTALLSSSLSYAESLQCPQSYDIFNQNVAASKHLMEAGDSDAFFALARKNAYSQLFQSLHPNQVFVRDEWIDEKEYEEEQKSFIQLLAQQPKDYQLIHIKYKLPKVNFMADIGEVCVIPTQEMVRYEGEIFKSRYDTVYVRNTLDNHWRGYVYNGTEAAEDLSLFFPNILKQLKLSKRLINGMNMAEFQQFKYLKYIKQHNLPMSDGLNDYVQQEYLKAKQRLKANGH